MKRPNWLLVLTAFVWSFTFGLFICDVTFGASAPATFTVSWTDNSTDETEWVVERKLRQDPATAYSEIARFPTPDGPGVGGTVARDDTVPTDTQFCYRVKASNPATSSEYATAAGFPNQREVCLMVTPSGVVVVFKNG